MKGARLVEEMQFNSKFTTDIGLNCVFYFSYITLNLGVLRQYENYSLTTYEVAKTNTNEFFTFLVAVKKVEKIKASNLRKRTQKVHNIVNYCAR